MTDYLTAKTKRRMCRIVTEGSLDVGGVMDITDAKYIDEMVNMYAPGFRRSSGNTAKSFIDEEGDPKSLSYCLSTGNIQLRIHAFPTVACTHADIAYLHGGPAPSRLQLQLDAFLYSEFDDNITKSAIDTLVKRMELDNWEDRTSNRNLIYMPTNQRVSNQQNPGPKFN
jgi:hypothetical protein